ncbi:site-specific integrase [Limnofasciculus baicalensis]|uniref:Site-specific integrase n=1 Tax=Limnofasciculus baicalensis BBK-W-15 TaxID=2699891 RepID=A0AAE3KPP0_9CYAN|nr:site-specific integrase [Limnofasciculus baicalensis]MCP2729868.1 site-specific integrase [Limnofasciculus baicalensis BBK-W-15]
MDRQQTTLLTLWDDFRDYKSLMISPVTIKKYDTFRHHLQSFFASSVIGETNRAIARGFLIYLKDKTEQRSGSLLTAKGQIGYLNAMWNWGRDEGLIDFNLPSPFSGLSKEIKSSPKQPPRPFTREEITLILNGFSRYYPHYLPYVQFLFSTGMRVGEAAGLLWRHINWEQQSIWIGELLTRGSRNPTKARKTRVIPMNEKIKSIIEVVWDTESKDCSLVFVSLKGNAIDDHNFNKRVWKNVLKKMGVTYRRPYNCRHTFISHCLESGLSPNTVASLTGHNVDTLYKNYSGCVISKPVIPELF